MLVVPGVLGPHDAAALIRMADEGGLWRESQKMEVAGSSGRRTSASAQLDSLRVIFSPAVMRVRTWVASALGVPDSHVESLQVVRYYKGQQYTRHVDWSPQGDPELWTCG